MTALKALVFDVFGTVVDRRECVAPELAACSTLAVIRGRKESVVFEREHRRPRSAVATFLCAALLCGGANGNLGAANERGTVPADDKSGTTAPGPEVARRAKRYINAMNPDLQSIARAAVADAARRTGLDASTLKVISSEAVTWPDGGLGCPEPGMLYTMALVPGYRIRIQAGDKVLDYHASRRGNLVLCPPERSVDPVPGGPT